MYLERLEIFGFKSFAQKTIFEFPQSKKENAFSITVIVGPNGCGKSNIVDAIRWGLGEQSLKLLRGKKSEDVIFSGSNKKTRLNLAEVSLYFNNEDRKVKDIDWSNFVISRRVYRGGECEYFINNTKVRLQDILVLLAKTKFGQKSYSIIGQGMIDLIIHSSNVERKNFFDEATGIKHYQLKKEEAVRKIEKTKENLKQAEIAINELKPRMRSLTRQVKRLERRKEIEEKLADLQKKYYSSLWNSLVKNEKILKNRLEKFNKKKKFKKEEIENIQENIEEMIGEQMDKGYDLIQKKYQDLLKIKSDYLEKVTEIKIQINELMQSKIHLKNEKKFNLTISNILKRLKEISSKQHLSLKSFERDKNLEKFKMQIQKITEEIDNLIRDILPREDKLEDDQRINLLKKKKQEITEMLKKVNKEIDETLTKLKDFSNQEKRKRKKMYELQKMLQIKQNELNEINNEINLIEIELAKIETKKETVKKEIKDEKITIDNKILVENAENLLSELQKLKYQLELIGGIDPEITKEYQECKQRWEFLSNQTKDLKNALLSLEKVVKELDKKIDEQFKRNFAEINKNFEKYFKVFFNGGQAKLLLKKTFEKADFENKEQKQQKIIEILAIPPGKKIRHLEALSGGEKALTSLSLICAVIATSRPPFVVFDEVDSALDEENSLRFANILKELSKQTQFIIISHNRQVINSADILYGVTMDHSGISKIISLKMEK